MRADEGILSCFGVNKPIIGMIHCKGVNDEDMFARAVREIDIYRQHGVDGVIVETYFGTYHQVVEVLKYLNQAKLGIKYGVNCLNNDAMCFELAKRFNCEFLQLDSVIGHVKPRDEETQAAFLEMERNNCSAYVMGGVRFKYQPVLSEHSVEEDLEASKLRCDAVCVTQDATGEQTSMDKIIQFRNCLGDFPLFVCAGVTPEHVFEELSVADGAVVGSYFKDSFEDSGDVCVEHVEKLMKVVRAVRQEY